MTAIKPIFNLVVGLAGPYGAGCSAFSEELERILYDWPNCKVEVVDVTELIEGVYPLIFKENIKHVNQNQAERRKAFQNAGTKLRRVDKELIGKLIAADILERGSSFQNIPSNTNTIIFIVDCLKNSNEVEFLRRCYSKEFYMIFIHADREMRWRRMVDYNNWKNKDRVKFEERDLIDQNEKAKDDDKPEGEKIGDTGQEVGKLSGIADYYIVNDQNREQLRADGERLIELLFGGDKNQPTLHERSMHVAFSAANRSFCLSRQVGAAIVNSGGDLLGIGHNDVPKASGGLYNQGDDQDKRCFLTGNRRCINDTNKQERFEEISKCVLDSTDDFLKQVKEDLCKEIIAKLGVNTKLSKEIKHIINKSSFSEATEYCRAVHAEMEALFSVARTCRSPVGATMYVTTEPCHNCTKHLICAGIKKVVYMEPYPKSLGIELHSDAIILGSEKIECTPHKVLFAHYRGVAPKRYHDFFEMHNSRKDTDGKYKRRSKELQSEEPRFARFHYPRVRDLDKPDDPITSSEIRAGIDINKIINNKLAEKEGE